MEVNTLTRMNVYQRLDAMMKSHAQHNDLPGDFNLFYRESREGMDSDSEKMLAAIMMQALSKKLNAADKNENIYLKSYEVSQIQLFNILISKLPFVKYSQGIINTAILDLLKDQSEAVIIDIGIGQGTQMVNILKEAGELKNLERLVIVGIEPFEEGIGHAEKNINAFSGKLPFELEFIAIREYIEKVDFNMLRGLPAYRIVNASLALHHIQTSGQRDKILEGINSLNPVALYLIEPNVNHFEPDFYNRFQNCYRHFSHLFNVIDAIDITQDEKNALKLFFGREIEDILGKPENERFEKHEPATHWLKRLRNQKFRISDEFADICQNPGYGVNIRFHKEGYLGFTVDHETVLAVISAN